MDAPKAYSEQARPFCENCGQELSPDARYCPHCGAARQAKDAAASPGVSPVLVPTMASKPRRRARVPLLIACFAGLGILFLLNGRTLLNDLGGAVIPSCTVGLAGAAVSVTAQGVNAQGQCTSFLSTTTDGGSWYLYSGAATPGGAVICQVPFGGSTLTVRDEGALDLYGSQICRNLIKAANPVVETIPPATACGLQIQGHEATVLATADVCTDFENAYPPASGGSWIGYPVSTPPSGDTLVCTRTFEGASINVWDSGGQFYGADLCGRING